MTDCERVDVAALFDRWQFCRFSYFRDYEFEAKVIEAAVKFYKENLLKKVEPELITIDDVKAKYSHAKLLSKIEADQKIYDSFTDMQRLKEHIKSEESKYEQLQLQVMNYMKDNSLLGFEGFTIASWKEQTRTSFDGMEFKKTYPELYNKYLKTNTHRVFKLL